MLQIPFQIGYLSYRDCIRQPIYLILLLASYATVGIQPILAQFAFREQQKLVTDGALATMLTFGMLTAVICANRVIARDIESGTALLVLSKPVSRITFLIAKFVGVLVVVSLFAWINGIGAIAAVRIARDDFDLDRRLLTMYYGCAGLACAIGAAANRFRRDSFPGTATAALGIGVSAMGIFLIADIGLSDPGFRNRIVAIALVAIALWIMGIIACATATRFSLMPSLLLCGGVFLAGLISDYLYLRAEAFGTADLALLLENRKFLIISGILLAWSTTTLVLRRTAIGRALTHDETRLYPADGSEIAVRTASRTDRFRKRTGQVLNFLFGVTLLAVLVVVRNEPPVAITTGPIAARLAAITIPVKDAAAEMLHTVIPNWQLLWMADALVANQMIPMIYVAHALAYCALFFILTLSVTHLIFRRRDLQITAA